MAVTARDSNLSDVKLLERTSLQVRSCDVEGCVLWVGTFR